MAWALVVRPLQCRPGLLSLFLALPFLCRMSLFRGHPSSQQPELTPQGTALSPALNLYYLAQLICFLSLDFHVFLFFFKIEITWTYLQGSSGYLLKRMKNIKTREKENSQGPAPPPVTPDPLNLKLQGGSNVL